MYIGEFYFQFPLWVVSGPEFPVVKGYLPVFTEALLAEQYCKGNQVLIIHDLDELEYVSRYFDDDTAGICFDPVEKGNHSTSKLALPWELLRMGIEIERIDPDGRYIETED